MPRLGCIQLLPWISWYRQFQLGGQSQGRQFGWPARSPGRACSSNQWFCGRQPVTQKTQVKWSSNNLLQIYSRILIDRLAVALYNIHGTGVPNSPDVSQKLNMSQMCLTHRRVCTYMECVIILKPLVYDINFGYNVNIHIACHFYILVSR